MVLRGRGSSDAFTDLTSVVVSNGLILVVSLAVMFVLSWQFALLTLVALPVGVAGPAETAAGEPQAARSGGTSGLRPDESEKTGPEDGSSAGN